LARFLSTLNLSEVIKGLNHISNENIFLLTERKILELKKEVKRGICSVTDCRGVAVKFRMRLGARS
jgi:hypothetical protein